MNTFTNRAIRKRAGCFDPNDKCYNSTQIEKGLAGTSNGLYGFNCYGSNESKCSNPLNPRQLAGAPTSTCSDCYPDNAILAPTASDSQRVVLSTPQGNSDISTFNFYAHSDKVCSPPVFVNRFYQKYRPEEDYDVAPDSLGDITKMSDSEYFQAVTTKTLKGPIELLITSVHTRETDTAENAIYYYTTNGEDPTYKSKTFRDGVVEGGQLVYIVVRDSYAPYLTGKVTVKAFTHIDGKVPSAITTMVFTIKNLNRIGLMPRGRITPYVVEYLSNWFDILRGSETLDSFFGTNEFVGDSLIVSANKTPIISYLNQNIIEAYLSYIFSYPYTGASNKNRDKLNTGYRSSTVTIKQANTFTYGNSSTLKSLLDTKMADFLNSNSINNWLKNATNPIIHSSLGSTTYRN